MKVDPFSIHRRNLAGCPAKENNTLRLKWLKAVCSRPWRHGAVEAVAYWIQDRARHKQGYAVASMPLLAKLTGRPERSCRHAVKELCEADYLCASKVRGAVNNYVPNLWRIPPKPDPEGSEADPEVRPPVAALSDNPDIQDGDEARPPVAVGKATGGRTPRPPVAAVVSYDDLSKQSEARERDGLPPNGVRPARAVPDIKQRTAAIQSVITGHCLGPKATAADPGLVSRLASEWPLKDGDLDREAVVAAVFEAARKQEKAA